MTEPGNVVNVAEGKIDGDIIQAGGSIAGGVTNVVRGTVRGTVIQLGTVHGGINVNAIEREGSGS